MKKRECIRCRHEESSDTTGCYIGIPRIKIYKYHRYKPLKKTK